MAKVGLNEVLSLLCMLMVFRHTRGKIYCQTGLVRTHGYDINYNITKMIIYEDSCYSGLEILNGAWPGSPTNFTVRYFDNATFVLGWKPPDDGSANDLTGFVIQMFIDTHSSTQMPGPTCYRIQLASLNTTSRLDGTPPGYIQNALFTVRCQSNYTRPITVNVFITSIPTPPSTANRAFKEESVQFNLTATTKSVRQPSTRPASSTLFLVSTMTTSGDTDSTTIALVSTISVFTLLFVIFGSVVIVWKQRSARMKCPDESLHNNI